jgi:HEAT repeat protein
MTTPTSKLAAAIALLNDLHSPKRRSGAKQLRKLQNPTAGLPLFTALQQELRDPRTWETQYQMIMALGECNYTPALSYLKTLAAQPFDATMVYMALGDAIIRLERTHDHDATPALRLLPTNNTMLIEGAFRAVAMLRMIPSQNEIQQIMQYVSQQTPPWGVEFWVAAAAAGWSGAEVDAFLTQAAKSHNQQLQQAAVAAQQKKYLKWRPL